MFLFFWGCGAVITGLLALLTRGRKTYIEERLDSPVLTIPHPLSAASCARPTASVFPRPRCGLSLSAGQHGNVGLLHGMMGIFNAWCDGAPNKEA
jgi:hypothetical protein